jgi:antitoxin component YwqK of YwqJK toxin-antitoxin module
VKRVAIVMSSALLLCATASSHAVQVCEMNGQWVNPANGNTTAGKTGLMRCRDGDGGPVVREQEIQNGVFMGIVRYYKVGVLEREYSVNEKGNRDGRSREFAAKAGATNPLLREETSRNGTTVGIARTWYESGQLKRVSFNTDAGQTEAVAEFSADGKLSELRCAGRAQLAPHADDAAWCGHGNSAPVSVNLYGSGGQIRSTLTHERGALRKSETLWNNGKPQRQIENNAQGGSERAFSEAGVIRKEVQWLNVANDGRTNRITVLEREHHENGTLVFERRLKPAERAAQVESEQRWYLNGQPREKREFTRAEGKITQRETQYHDNGKPSFEGVYLLEGRFGRQALGIHKSYDAEGRLRSERHYDARGRVTRERELDEAGAVKRDDEVFEDGSRKAYSR